MTSNKKHILIAEDESLIASLYQEFLNYYGYQSTICTDGASALSTYRNPNNHFDLVVTDQNMPYMTGTELSKTILELTPDIPIILLTGFNDEETLAEIKQVGVEHCLKKPVNLPTLKEAIDNCLT